MKIDTAIIMNPSAHDWEAGKKWPAMIQLLKKYGIAYRLIETRPDAKTVQMAKEAAQKGYRRVVAVGGDGTINEVFNGIMKSGVRRRPKVALVPFGTANDISKSFKIRVEDLDECIRTLVDGLDYPLDLGLVDGERYFADAFTIGYDASVLK
ncbi:MAG: diacylglycerol kinase family protein, partial [Pseudomonadota bacterium]